MSCLTLKIGLPPIGIVSSGAKPTGWFDVDVKNKNPKLTTSKIGNIVVDVALICRASNGFYLRVKPSEAMWITVGKGIDYQVISNTDWIIE